MVGVIIGPGHHHNSILEALKREKIPFRYAKHWPALEVWEVDSQGNSRVIYTSRLFKLAEFLLYKIWKWWPARQKKYFHREMLLALYDYLVSGYFRNCKVLIGWSQVSLFSARKVKNHGGHVILEHPMVHAGLWDSVIKEEYRKFGQDSLNLKSLRSNWMIRRMQEEYRVADQINLLSEFAVTSFVQHGVAKAKLKIKYLFSSFSHKTEVAKAKDKNRFVILYVGRIELLKGVPYLIEAFQKLAIPNAELWLVGKNFGEFPIPKQPGIKLIGEVNKEGLAELYKQADVLVFPSLLDAFGLVILEALAFNVPVISTTSSGAPDVKVPGSMLKVIPPRSAEAIAAALETVYNEPEKQTDFELPFTKEAYLRSILADILPLVRK
jgi:starch synthase